MQIDYNFFIFIFALCYSVFFVILTIALRNSKYRKVLRYVSIVYKGFSYYNARGILKGAIWAFVDGIITGVIVAFILRFAFS